MSQDDTARFAPTLEAAHARLAALRPSDYARSRNHLGGAVTRLSPYLTHGMLSLPHVVEQLRLQHGIGLEHKLMQELGWRAFFQHAWRHDGEGIFASLHPGPLPDAAYAQELPADIREGRSGVPVIDQAVRALYREGYVHNHARMWLASYVVHLRKVHWRAGADWMVGHLLDGDLGSNHLSWQWVAGTGSSKPYLFNVDNVTKYAPAAWHSPGTAIDTSYAALHALAHQPRDDGPEPGEHCSIAEPALLHTPPMHGFSLPDARAIAGRDVWLVHPWSLGEPPADLLPVALCDAAFHARWPWSAARWRFVAARMAAITPLRWFATQAELQLALAAARTVQGWANLHLGDSFAMQGLSQPPLAFAEPATRCRSFFAFWPGVNARRPHQSTNQGESSHV